MIITSEQLQQIMPHLPTAKRELYLPFLNAAMEEFEINNELRAAAFLAQLAHESVELKYMEEIASGAAYEGRRDLGNTQPGDGRRYKGRGPIQLTGRANYRRLGKALGLPLEDNPQIATKPENAFRIAAYFWNSHNLNSLADARKFKAITKAINGGYNGLDSRVKYYERALRVLPDNLTSTGDTEVSDLDEEESPAPLPSKEPIAEDKGTTTTAPEPSEGGTPPPTPAMEIVASKPSLMTKISSLSFPPVILGILAAVGKWFMNLPPWAIAGMFGMACVIGYLIWRDSQQRHHQLTLKVMDAAADQNKNNLRLVSKGEEEK